MFCFFTLRFDQGRPLPKASLKRSFDAALFQIDYEGRFGPRTGGRIARLLSLDGKSRDLVAPLYKPDVVIARGGKWSVRGVEVLEQGDATVHVEQAWVLTEVSGRTAEEIEYALAHGERVSMVLSG